MVPPVVKSFDSGDPKATNFGYYVGDDTPCANRSSLRFVDFYTSCCVNDHFEVLTSHMDHLPLRFQKAQVPLVTGVLWIWRASACPHTSGGLWGEKLETFCSKVMIFPSKATKSTAFLKSYVEFNCFHIFCSFNWNSYLEERLKPHWSAYSSHHLIGTHFDIGWFGPSSIGRDQAGTPIELPWWIVETQWFLSLLGYQGVRMFGIDLARFFCMANTSNTVAFLKRGKKRE